MPMPKIVHYVENGQDALEKVSLKDAPGGMFADGLKAVTRYLSTIRVSELRKKLHEKGLDIDGSKEAMIVSLKVYVLFCLSGFRINMSMYYFL